MSAEAVRPARPRPEEAWRSFERQAGRYEAWYETSRGRRVSRAEKRLLEALIVAFPDARSVIDIGCGTGHFTRWLAESGAQPIGLDRAPAMLRELVRAAPQCLAVRADAEALPFSDAAVDVSLLVTLLEFVDSPARVLEEAIRVARCGLLAVVLNRWSVGALSRCCGPASGRPLLGRAADASLGELQRMLERAAGDRFEDWTWRSALLPRPLPLGPVRLPVGDVLGVALRLRPAASPARLTRGAR